MEAGDTTRLFFSDLNAAAHTAFHFLAPWGLAPKVTERGNLAPAILVRRIKTFPAPPCLMGSQKNTEQITPPRMNKKGAATHSRILPCLAQGSSSPLSLPGRFDF